MRFCRTSSSAMWRTTRLRSACRVLPFTYTVTRRLMSGRSWTATVTASGRQCGRYTRFITSGALRELMPQLKSTCIFISNHSHVKLIGFHRGQQRRNTPTTKVTRDTRAPMLHQAWVPQSNCTLRWWAQTVMALC